MIHLPECTCPRGRGDCIALANIIADDESSFFCCGENDGSTRQIEQDRYTVCFKGEYRDAIDHYDKRDLIHHTAVMAQALACIQSDFNDSEDWSPWRPSQDTEGQ